MRNYPTSVLGSRSMTSCTPSSSCSPSTSSASSSAAAFLVNLIGAGGDCPCSCTERKSPVDIVSIVKKKNNNACCKVKR